MGKDSYFYRIRHWLILFVAIAIFIGIIHKGMVISPPGDEHRWYYSGYLVSKGFIPYKDFFYGHPPMHAVFLSFLFLIFEFNLFVLKLVPLISTIISSILIFCIVKKRYGDLPAILSSLMFLFSYSVLFNSVFSFGVSFAAMIALFAYYFYEKERYFLSGVIFGIASLTRLLVLIPIIVIFAWSFLKKRNSLSSFSSGFLGMFGIANILLIIFFKMDYIKPVYLLHLFKNPLPSLVFKEYLNVINLNWILFTLVFLYFVFERKINLPCLISLAFLASMLMVKRLYGYYFIIGFPFMAMLGGIALSSIFSKIKEKKRILLIPFTIIFVGLFLWNLSANIMFLNSYGFLDFQRLDEISSYVSNFDSSFELFGDESIVPFLALKTNRKIALNYFDTNEGIFESKVIDLNLLLRRLEGHKIIFIVRDIQGISKFSEVRKYLNEKCHFESQFNDKIEKGFIIYSCSN